MKKVLIILLFISQASFSESTVEIDPSELQIGPIIHETLPPELLKRIKNISDTFEIVDGIGYCESVDLYKRDLNPEANIVIYEEMARVYKKFCKNRCTTQNERMDVYRLVLLRSMFPENEVLERVHLNVVNKSEAINILKNYKLKAEPITVIQK